MLGVLEGDRGQNLFCLPPVALIRHEHRHFVPDVLEPFVVVRDRLGEDQLVRDMYDAAGALIRVDPDTNLVQRELEQMDVDDIATVFGDFDAIADLERSPPHDERPPREIGQRILEGDREARRGEAEECGERCETYEPLAADHQDGDRESQVRNRLAPAIALPRVGDPPINHRQDEPLDDPQPRDHDHRDQQVHLYRWTQADTVLQPVAHGGQSYGSSYF